MNPSTRRWRPVCFIALANLVASTVVGGEDGVAAKAIVDSKLPTESRTFSKGERRITAVYRVPGNNSRTNRVCTIWEKQVAGRWVIDSRSYYVGGERVLSEYDFDENGVAGKILISSGDELLGVLRKGNQITGVLPQAEIDEIKAIEKSATSVGTGIGSGALLRPIIEGNDAGKTSDEIAKDLREKVEELKKKPAQEQK